MWYTLQRWDGAHQNPFALPFVYGLRENTSARSETSEMGWKDEKDRGKDLFFSGELGLHRTRPLFRDA